MGIVYPGSDFLELYQIQQGRKWLRPDFSETGKNKVKLCVEDNGIGIRPEELGRVFEKGFCGTNGRSGRYSTGIGLYLTKKLCDRLGMVIRIESEYGQYTRVWLQFPESDFQKIGREKTFQN